MVGATGGAVVGSQNVATVTITKNDSPNGVVRFLNESLVTLVNPNSTLKLNLVLERAGGLVGNAMVSVKKITSLQLSQHWLFAMYCQISAFKTCFNPQVAWIILGPNSRTVLLPFNTDIREPVNGSFFFRDGEEGTRSIELIILPHGEVEVEETFVVELNILSGDMDIDPQAGSVTLKVLN